MFVHLIITKKQDYFMIEINNLCFSYGVGKFSIKSTSR